jgi:mRNA interferase HigB
VHIITKRVLRESLLLYPDAEPSLRLWQKVTQKARWSTMMDVKRELGSADAVGKLTIFNISGNRYRLITYIDYRNSKVFIRGPLLTHKQYDAGNWKNDDWF